MVFAATTSDGFVHFYYRIGHNNIYYWECFPTGQRMLKIWYLQKHLAWICMSEDAKLHQIQINRKDRFFVWD